MNAAIWLLVACAVRGTTRDDVPVPDNGPSSGDPPSAPPPNPVPDLDAAVLGVSRVRACPDGSGDTTTLAEAAARAGDGGVVVACGTVWRESLTLAGGTLTLVGEAGTVLEGVAGSPILTVRDGGRLTLRSLTLTGGDAARGGAIACIDASFRGDGLVVSDSVAEGGGGLAGLRCAVELRDSTFAGNHARNDGGAVWLVRSSGSITRVSFLDGTAHRGGGLAMDGGNVSVLESRFVRNATTRFGAGAWVAQAPDTATFVGNDFLDNASVWSGGGLYVEGGSPDVSGNTFASNTTTEDGAGMTAWSASPIVSGNTFDRNIAEDDAGGLRLMESHAVVTDNTFSANVGTYGDGGAVKVSHAASLFRGNVYEGNTSGGAGGALEVDDDSSSFEDETLHGNHTDGDGGALHTNIPNWDVRVERSSFADNTADGCGGALAATASPFTVRLLDSEVTDNVAGRGGGLCAKDGALDVQRTLVYANEAREGGGVWSTNAPLTLTNVTLAGNSARSGAGVMARGGGIALQNSIVSDHLDGPAIEGMGDAVCSARWSLTWENAEDVRGIPSPWTQEGNLVEDPRFVDPAAGNYGLAPDSPARDAGDPALLDDDGTRSDMGATGGAGTR